jgi:hypothetical protein
MPIIKNRRFSRCCKRCNSKFIPLGHLSKVCKNCDMRGINNSNRKADRVYIKNFGFSS